MTLYRLMTDSAPKIRGFKEVIRSLLGAILWSRLRIIRNAIRGVDTTGIWYDHLTFKIIKKCLRPDSICIDVGCHKGDVLSVMRYYAPKGKFYAFEPLPYLYT